MGADAAALEGVQTDEARPAEPVRRVDAPSGVPMLEPAPGGLAERFADAVGAEHPVRVFLVAAVAGYLLLVGASIALGILLTRVLLHIGGLASSDESINRWLARERTPDLVDASWVGSTLAGGLVIPIVVGILLLAFVLSRHWRLAAFTLFAICIESGSYRATTLAVHRDRPRVDRLESLPADASFPSGHTAASIALFSGLLLLLASRIENLALKLFLWSLALAIPAFVLLSRMLRGMHHLTDSLAGVLLGIAAFAVTVFAARAAGAAAARRDARRTTETATR
jgi:undecaprenyl-diphosphatase